MSLFVLAPMIGSSGCDSHDGQAPPRDPAAPATAPDAPSPGTAGGAAAPASVVLVGEWVSSSCGARQYPRHITFDDRNGFSASDLVSPCPAGVVCVWSGIVVRHGRWSSDGHRVTLTVSGAPPRQGAPFPEALELSPGPTENDASGAICPYERTIAEKP